MLKTNNFDILFIGTALVDSIIKGFNPNPISVSGYRAKSSSLNVGGEAVNGSMAAAKLGEKVAILCSLGNDVAGSMVTKELLENGVDCSCIIKSPNHPTPITTMFVRDDGSRQSITNTSHSYNFHPEQYVDFLNDTKAIVLGSLFRAPFDDHEVIKSVVSFAHEKGIIVFADTKLPNFKKINLKDISESLPMIDYITPNEDEGRYFSGEDEPEKMADVFLNMGVRNVIIKLGSKGCFFKNKDTSIYLPSYDINAVDATGAGDNFLAGFVSEIIHGCDIKKALIFANACGAICSTAVGAGTALRNREQVENFIDSFK